MIKKRYIAIRTGKLDKEDAMEEVDKIIKEKGYCWFGKYGQPLNKMIKEGIKKDDIEYYVVLIQTDPNAEDGYKYKAYKMIDIRGNKPKDTAYPEYYKKIFSRIGVWLKLEKYNGKKVNLTDLVVKSSATPLRRTLRSSLRGHFSCYLRG